MDWIKKHYDGVALVVAALLGTGLALFTILQALQIEQAFEGRNSAKPKDNQVAEADTAPLQSAGELLDGATHWGGHEGSLFVSRIYIESAEGNLIDIMEDETPLHPPVPNDWLVKFDLDYTRSDILSTDPDGDGFTVLEEYRASTDPSDPGSVPPYWTKLRLQEYERIPFKVKFSGTPDGGTTFTINFIDNPAEPTRFLKIGDAVNIAGVPYTLTKYEPKTTIDEGLSRDVSELHIEHEPSGETIVLVNDKVVDSPTSFAIFTNLLDGEVKRIKKGDSFSMAQEPEVEYRVDEITQQEATVTNLKSGEAITIPK